MSDGLLRMIGKLESENERLRGRITSDDTLREIALLFAYEEDGSYWGHDTDVGKISDVHDLMRKYLTGD